MSQETNQTTKCFSYTERLSVEFASFNDPEITFISGIFALIEALRLNPAQVARVLRYIVERYPGSYPTNEQKNK